MNDTGGKWGSQSRSVAENCAIHHGTFLARLRCNESHLFTCSSPQASDGPYLILLVHEGRYAAEVEMDLIDADRGWSPYRSLPDAQKLDEVHRALIDGDLKRASQLAHVFQLLPVNV